MRSYLNIVQNVLDYGKWKENRTGIRTLALPNQHFSHNMSEGFPLLTTRRMPFKSMTVELEGFVKGITSKRWYKERGCHFWDEWANPSVVKRKLDKVHPMPAWGHGEGCVGNSNWIAMNFKKEKEIQKDEDDLGPIYGFSWRKFGEVYDENDDGVLSGYDQLEYIVDTLKTNPNDRRMVCSAWNPNQLNIAALPACHICFVVTHIDGVLHLHWTQRSCDLPLGVCNNIASYALLLSLLCKESGFQPGNLSGILCDCHIYENQIDGLKEQLKREPRTLPSVSFKDWNGIFNWSYDDTVLENYSPHKKISLGDIAV